MKIRKLPVKGPEYIGAVNTYLIGKDKLTLVDTGPNFAKSFRDIVTGIEDYGLKPQDLEEVIITHPHYDHFGNACKLKEEFDAKIIAHKDAEPLIANYEPYMSRFRSFFSDYLLQHGMPEEEVERALQGLPTPGDISAEIQSTVQGGDQIELDGGVLEVIDSPGHATGSISLSAREDGVVLTGDNLLKDITPNPMLQLPAEHKEPEDSLPDYIQTLNSFSGINNKGLPGHGDNIENVGKRADEIIDHHMNRKEEIFDQMDVETTSYRLMHEIFPDVSEKQYFYAISEVIGHLELLRREGRAELKHDNRKLYHRSK